MKHLALIMDGNRRWARAHKLSALMGHDNGANTLKDIARAVAKQGIPFLSVFAFSTENWRRSPEEVSGLLQLMRKFLMSETQSLVDENMRLVIIGDRTAFDKGFRELFETCEAASAHCAGLVLTVAINYGGQQDILQAISEAQKQFPGEEISSDMIKSCLMTSHLPPVDLLIRTGGEKRVSNFLLWDLSYAELYFSDKFWPDFSSEDLNQAVADFQHRTRRFGGDVASASEQS
ncbi:MAG: polyprenyl diphosphate synthase [Alphaproteobacteria bacterium]|nr:polyprenyl diphosphate synthase [Alphaproteobacteria bacterium]